MQLLNTNQEKESYGARSGTYESPVDCGPEDIWTELTLSPRLNKRIF
jgi:hypothetical protein